MKSILFTFIIAAFTQIAAADVSCTAEWNSGALVNHSTVTGVQLGLLQIGYNTIKGTDRAVEFQSINGRFTVTLHSSTVPEMAGINFYEGLSAPTKFKLSFKNANGDQETLFLNCQNK